MESPRGGLEMDFITKITNITKNPEIFLGVQENVAKELISLLKLVYDYTKTAEPGQTNNEALPELIIQDFDEEQIWQELELQNDFKVNSIMSDAARLAVQKEKLALSLIADTDEEEEEEKDESDADDWENDDLSDDGGIDGGETDDDSYSSNDDSEKSVKKARIEVQIGPKKKSVVDDKFFKLEELNAFLEQEDEKDAASRKNFGERDDESDDDSDDIDLFEDIQGDEEGLPKYSDFFSAPHSDKDSGKDNDANNFENENKGEEENDDENDKEDNVEEDLGSESGGFSNKKKRVRFDLSKDNDVEIKSNELPVPESNENKSHFEICQDRLRKKIGHLEAAALSEKPWQMKGEVSSTLRPENSLLEEVVDFQMASRPAPIFTEVTTVSLESLIKSRIKARDFDDVSRQVKTVFVNRDSGKKLVLNEEKSKQSLAEVYEQDYQSKLNLKRNPLEGSTPENGMITVIRKEMAALFIKLDALANNHFMPKPSLPELRIITNVSAVNMEEVAPIATTTGSLLAPEEVKAKMKGELMSKEERTTTDKKRERRHKKKMQKYRGKAQKSKLFQIEVPGFKAKKEKKTHKKLVQELVKSSNVSEVKGMNGVRVTKSSTSFFSSLQYQVQEVKTRKPRNVTEQGAGKSGKKKGRKGKGKKGGRKR